MSFEECILCSGFFRHMWHNSYSFCQFLGKLFHRNSFFRTVSNYSKTDAKVNIFSAENENKVDDRSENDMQDPLKEVNINNFSNTTQMVMNSPKTAGKCQMDNQKHLQKRRRIYDNVELSVMNLSTAVTSHLNAEKEKISNSDDEVFGQLIISELKKLPDSAKAEIKKSILRIIYDM